MYNYVCILDHVHLLLIFFKLGNIDSHLTIEHIKSFNGKSKKYHHKSSAFTCTLYIFSTWLWYYNL